MYNIYLLKFCMQVFDKDFFFRDRLYIGADEKCPQAPRLF